MTNRITKATLLADLTGLCARASIRYNSGAHLDENQRERLFSWLLFACDACEPSATKSVRSGAVEGLRRLLDETLESAS